MTEELASYTRTFTSFSGAYCVAVINGERVIGEIQEIKWTKEIGLYSTETVTGEIVAVLFNKECPLMEYKDEQFNILMLFQNEYGQSKADYIEGVELKEVSSGMSVDSVIQESCFKFSARDAFTINDFPINAEAKVEYFNEKLGTRRKKDLSREERRDLKIVQEHLLYEFIQRGWKTIHASELAYLKATPQERLTKDLKRQLWGPWYTIK